MPQNNWFQNWFNSNDYHQLYQNRNENEADHFLQHLIHYLNPPADSTILDVACGKGRHSKALADKAYHVTGIDLSFNSILEAKHSESENLSFYQHDMRLPFWINYFDYVFNFFTSFGYFATQRENNNALKSMAQSLKKKGILVLDYLNIAYEELISIPAATKEINGNTYQITKWNDASFFYKKIEKWEKEKKEFIHLSTERVAKFSFQHFTEMLTLQGLQVQTVFGDYHLNTYNVQESPRMIIIAQKL